MINLPITFKRCAVIPLLTNSHTGITFLPKPAYRQVGPRYQREKEKLPADFADYLDKKI
jgi:hypothetical protein